MKAVVDHERLGAGRWLNDDGLPEGGGVVTQHQAGGIGDPRRRRTLPVCFFFHYPSGKISQIGRCDAEVLFYIYFTLYFHALFLTLFKCVCVLWTWWMMIRIKDKGTFLVEYR